MIHVEICCNSILSARNAKNGGASRIELCQALGEGGTTPSAAAIEYCVTTLNLQTRVLVRPRGGNFVYDNDETRLILRDIEHAHKLGAHAVVVGFLTADGDIDTAKTIEAVKAAEGLSVTFHRAFDLCRNPFDALERVIDCGCDKLLTSGCETSAMAGRQTLARLTRQAAGRIAIIGAAGITVDNVAQLIEATALEEVHASLKRTVGDLTFTDADQVRHFIRITNTFNNK